MSFNIPANKDRLSPVLTGRDSSHPGNQSRHRATYSLISSSPSVLNASPTTTSTLSTPATSDRPLPSRGPLNEDVIMGPHRRSLPYTSTQRPRPRKRHTKEVAPENGAALANLGMSPFMIGQDAMHNQNRLVRNESVLAQKFLDLRKKVFDSETERVKTAQNMYHLISNQNACIDNLARRTGLGGSHCPDPQVAKLFDAQAEMRRNMDKLWAHMSNYTADMKDAMENMEARIEKMISGSALTVGGTPPLTPTNPRYDYLSAHMGTGQMSGSTLQRKRKREVTYSARDVSTCDGPCAHPHSTNAMYAAYRRRRTQSPIRDTTVADDISPAHANAINSNVVRSARDVLGTPEFINIRSTGPEYAAHSVSVIEDERTECADRTARLVRGDITEGDGLVGRGHLGSVITRSRSDIIM